MLFLVVDSAIGTGENHGRKDNDSFSTKSAPKGLQFKYQLF